VLAGGLGAVARFLVISALPVTSTRLFPVGVLTVNALGSLLAGITLGLLSSHVINFDFALIMWAGLCGGLTTFSTVAVETIVIGRNRPRIAWLNIGVTVIGGCASAAIGFTSVQVIYL
jgi:CrcB protein